MLTFRHTPYGTSFIVLDDATGRSRTRGHVQDVLVGRMISVDSGGSHVLPWMTDAHKATLQRARRQRMKLEYGWKRDQDSAAPWWKRITG